MAVDADRPTRTAHEVPPPERPMRRTWRIEALLSFPPIMRRPAVIIGSVIIGCMLFMAAFPSVVAGFFGDSDPRACDLANSRGRPQAGHPFGFDVQGCDLYNNVVYGARASLTIGIAVIAGTVAISVVLGCAAAYYRGWVDSVIGRAADVILGFPVLVGLVVILQALDRRTVWTISFVLVLFVWPSVTRIMRSTALAVVDLDYVRAAREMGAGPIRIVARHVVPNAFGPVAAISVLLVGAIITTESALTFLGVGLQRPSISWGVQLASAQDSFRTDPHLLLFPALFLTVTVLGFVLLGDGLRTDESARQAGG